MPTIAEFQEGRKNKDAYSFFCYFFLRRTIGHASFKDYFAGEISSVSALFTESGDEAFFWKPVPNSGRRMPRISEKRVAQKTFKEIVLQNGETKMQMGAGRQQQELCNEFDKYFREYLYKTSGGLFGVPKMNENITAQPNKKEEDEEEEVEIVFWAKNITAV